MTLLMANTTQLPLLYRRLAVAEDAIMRLQDAMDQQMQTIARQQIAHQRQAKPHIESNSFQWV